MAEITEMTDQEFQELENAGRLKKVENGYDFLPETKFNGNNSNSKNDVKDEQEDEISFTKKCKDFFQSRKLWQIILIILTCLISVPAILLYCFVEVNCSETKDTPQTTKQKENHDLELNESFAEEGFTSQPPHEETRSRT